MNCRKLKRYITEFLDGDLSREERDEFLTHYKTCQKCQERWGYQIKLSEKLSSSIGMFKKELEVPKDLLYDVLRSIRNIPQPKPIWDEVFGVLLRIPQAAYSGLIMTLSVCIAFSFISIADIGKAHPGEFPGKERIVVAHIHPIPSKNYGVYLAKKTLTKELAYSKIQYRPMYKFIESATNARRH